MAKISAKDLFEAGCHFGHQTRRWNPKMKPYIYGNRNGITIIDLSKTIAQISEACNFLQNIVCNGGRILFVGTKRQARDLVKEAAEKTNMYYVTERWMGGTLTNSQTIKKSIDRMKEIDIILENGGAGKNIKKKELSLMARKASNLHRDLDGIRNLNKLPDALVIVDLEHEDIAVKEATKLGIPVVAFADTNSNPELVAYPIASNDDAVRAIQVILDVLVENITIAGELWSKKYEEQKAVEAEAREKAKAEREAKATNASSNEENDKKTGRRRTARATGVTEGATAEGEKKIVRRRAPKPEAAKTETVKADAKA